MSRLAVASAMPPPTAFPPDASLTAVPVDLIDAVAGRLPTLPPLARAAAGYLITSLAEPRLDDLTRTMPGMLRHVRRRYVRYHTDLTLGFAAYWPRLSEGSRVRLKRAGRRIAQVSGGAVRVARHRSPAELSHFHDVAQRISARTCGERLLGAGMPDDDGFVAALRAGAAADRVRGWTLSIAGEPAAYLYAEGRGPVLRLEHSGHDPAFDDHHPGAVLLLEAMRDLMGTGADRDRFERFDFNPGEGRHKRAFATGGVPCVDVLLLRPSLGDRLTAGALDTLDQAVVKARRVAANPVVRGLASKVRRG